MPIVCQNTPETTKIVQDFDWIEECEIAHYQTEKLIRVKGNFDGCRGSYYFAHRQQTVAGSIYDIDFTPAMETCDIFDEYLSVVENIPGVDILGIKINDSTRPSNIRFVSAKHGYVSLDVHREINAEALIKRVAKQTRQDAEGNVISRLGAMILAIEAKSLEDVDKLVNAVFMADTLQYRYISTHKNRDGNIKLAYSHQNVELRSDGIEIPDLPETVRIAIKGKQRRRLGEIIEIPGFDDLDITGIYFNAQSRFKRPGKDWIRLDVRDSYGAKFEDMEIEDAREVARQTFLKRNPGM